MGARKPRVTYFHDSASRGKAPKLYSGHVSWTELKFQLLSYELQVKQVSLSDDFPVELLLPVSDRIDELKAMLDDYRAHDLTCEDIEPNKSENSFRDLPVAVLKNLLWHYIEQIKTEHFMQHPHVANVASRMRKKGLLEKNKKKLSGSLVIGIFKVFLCWHDGEHCLEKNFMTVDCAAERVAAVLGTLGIENLSLNSIKKRVYRASESKPVFFKQNGSASVRYKPVSKEKRKSVGKYDRSKPRSPAHH